MLSVTNNFFIICVIMLIAIMLIVVAPAYEAKVLFLWKLSIIVSDLRVLILYAELSYGLGNYL